MGLLGLFARSGANWVKGLGPMLGGGPASDLGRVMDGWRQWRVILLGHANSFRFFSATNT